MPVRRGVVRFGLFELDLTEALLIKNGHRIKLQEQPCRLLSMLLEHPGETVTREQLRQVLWPADTFVDFDRSMNAAVAKLRQALGDSAENPRFIETLARRGYRFIAPVSYERDTAPQPDASARALPLAPEPQPHAPGAVDTQRRWRRFAAGAIAVAALGIFLAAVLLRSTKKVSPADLHIAPLTSNTGLELQPSFSPDGTRIAYAWGMPPQKQPAIYVKLNGPGDAVKITGDLPRIFSPTWSPDGRWIAALQDLGSTGTILLIPALGGQPKTLTRVQKADPSADPCIDTAFSFICGAASLGSALAWSRDGKYVFTSAETAPGSPPGIVRVSVETGEVQPMTAPAKAYAGDFGPAVSPDGQQLAFGRFTSIRTGDLYLISLSDGGSLPESNPRRITTDSADVMTPAWMPDNRELIFSSNRGGPRELWRVSVGGGRPVRLAGIGEDAMDVAVSRDGRTLVYNHGHYSASLWKIPISAGKGGEPIRVTATTARDKYSQFSPDGKRITFESGRSGVDEIWICDADGANAVQLTMFGRGISGSPRWSPDGRMIAFDSNVAGSFDIYVIPSGGGRPVQLTRNPSTEAIPNWSRDGASIYFTSWRTGRAEVWKIPASGGSETQVTRDGGALATESTDGRYLYFVRGTDLYRMQSDGSHQTKMLTSVTGRFLNVFLKGLYFATGSRQTELRYLEFATGDVRVITPLRGLPDVDVSSDEHWVLYPQLSISDTNLMVAENFH